MEFSRKNFTPVTVLALTGLLALSACGESTPTEAEMASAAAKACATGNARPLASAADVVSIEDNREGGIYPCEYFLDERIPFNKEANLSKVSIETITSSDFSLHGDLGGLVIFGTGGLSGRLNAKGKTEQKNVSKITFTDLDGNLQTIALDTERPKIKHCPDECKPTVMFSVSEAPLWIRPTAGDESSIWYIDDSEGGSRRDVVSKVSLSSFSNNGEGDKIPYDGGPDKPGQVVSSLSSEIIIKLPKSAEQK